YQTEKTLPEFARKHLGKQFRVSFVFADARDRHLLPGLEVLKDADVLLVSVRRRPLRKEQMALVRQFVASGRPVVGIRTASHAFAPFKGQKLPAGVEAWPEFDRDVLGCHYDGHHGANLKTRVRPAAGAEKHPILAGVKGREWELPSSLYRSKPLAGGAVVLLTGRAGDNPAEPVAWAWQRKDGGRTFCTSLGHPGDFKEEGFVRLLRNGICWAAKVAVPQE
ncbi:MAG TPA: ThuA domain-containing protein, partial [Gemmataceae bacterium]|nr:ThuA domain-containing protein [Gemmataceae bacterium]